MNNSTLPYHLFLKDPRTGHALRAIGVGSRGPIWSCMGAEDPPPPPVDPSSGDPKPSDPPPGNEFKPPASQADLDRIIGERVARERAKYGDVAELRKKAEAHDKAIEAARTEQEKAVAAAREEGKTEALGVANTKLVNAEARALASELKFKNPNIAIRSIDLSGVAVDKDGEVDKDAITVKLKELAEAESYLLDDGVKPPPKKDPSQGGGNGGDKPSVERGKQLWADRRKPAKTTT